MPERSQRYSQSHIFNTSITTLKYTIASHRCVGVTWLEYLIVRAVSHIETTQLHSNLIASSLAHREGYFDYIGLWLLKDFLRNGDVQSQFNVGDVDPKPYRSMGWKRLAILVEQLRRQGEKYTSTNGNTKICDELRSRPAMVNHNLDSEAHSLPHFLRLLPVPRHLARTWVKIVAPDIVVDAAVTASAWVLILQEADNPRCKLTEELDGEDKRYDGNSNSTCKKHKRCD